MQSLNWTAPATIVPSDGKPDVSLVLDLSRNHNLPLMPLAFAFGQATSNLRGSQR
jgi:hypothetical protein